jgi:hypothetical protein
MRKLLCRVFGHSWVHYFSGVDKCKRCGKTVHPEPFVEDGKTMASIAQMRMHDPEWAMEYGSSPIAIGFTAFVEKHPDFSKRLTEWVRA